MREVEFRGKTDAPIDDLELKDIKHKNNWVYGTYIDGFIINGVIEVTEEYIEIETWCPVDRKTVGQYTGIKDINGTKIFEGDIVKMHVFFTNFDTNSFGAFEDEYELIGVVKSNELGPYLKVKDKQVPYYFINHIECLGEELEVLGNIHENKELLEVQK